MLPDSPCAAYECSHPAHLVTLDGDRAVPVCEEHARGLLLGHRLPAPEPPAPSSEPVPTKRAPAPRAWLPGLAVLLLALGVLQGAGWFVMGAGILMVLMTFGLSRRAGQTSMRAGVGTLGFWGLLCLTDPAVTVLGLAVFGIALLVVMVVGALDLDTTSG